MAGFRLQALLDHRNYVAEQVQKELGKLERELLDKIQTVQRCKQQRQRMAADADKRRRQGLTACEDRLYCDYLRRLGAELDKKEGAVVAVRRQMAQKRAELIRAVKKRKMLEKLKARWTAAERDDTQRREQRLLDEIAVNNYNRSRMTEGQSGE